MQGTWLDFASSTIMVALAGCYIAGFVYGFKALRRPAPGVRLFSRRTLWHPVNALFEPDLLSEQGNIYRMKCFRSFAAAGVCFCLFCFMVIFAAS